MGEIYLDNAATTKALPEVVTAIKDALTTNYANPSSLHEKGLEAEKLVKEARESLAQELKVNNSELYFTSGGTEANNLAILGAIRSLKQFGKRIITTKIEHPSVLNLFQNLEDEWDVKYLDVNQAGGIDLKQLQEYLNDDTILLSTMAVNNELGTIQPLEEISSLIEEYQKLFWHVDAIQALGKIDFFPGRLEIDLCSLSAHKIHGPKGVGALYAASGTKLKSIFYGSSQEEGLRPGTENVPGIAGFGQAVELLAKEKQHRMKKLKEMLVHSILDEIEGTSLNGPSLEEGAVHIANISFQGLKGEVLVHSLAEDNIYLSTGAACSSRRRDSNHVLEAIALESDLIASTLRFSLGVNNSAEEIKEVVNRLQEKVTMLRKII
ncbi:MAG: cysteine desulfurase family protein [Halanaerobacter sp.]